MSRLFVAVLCLVATDAVADSKAFDIDHLQLAISGGDFLATEGAGRVQPWGFRAGVSYRFLDAPLVMVGAGGERMPVVGARHLLEASGAVQFGKWVGVAVAVPVLLDSTGAGVPGGAAIGDIRVQPRVEILRGERLGLAALFGLRLPSGDTTRFLGEGGVVFEPKLAVEGYLAGGLVRVGANAGVRIRAARDFGDLHVGNEVFVHAALAFVPRPYIQALAELHADTAMGGGFLSRQETPVEALLGLAGGTRGVRASAAVGFGIVDGWGAPKVRAIFSVEYRRPPKVTQVGPVRVIAQPLPRPKPAAPPVVIDPLPELDEELPDSFPDEPAVRFVNGRIELADPVFFETDHARVRNRFRAELVELARALVRRPTIELVWIEGHADATGPARWNLQLSRLRAERVARFLSEHGVPSERLRPCGFGEAKPLEQTPAGEANERNRRVHFFTDVGPVREELIPASAVAQEGAL